MCYATGGGPEAKCVVLPCELEHGTIDLIRRLIGWLIGHSYERGARDAAPVGWLNYQFGQWSKRFAKTALGSGEH